MVTYGINRAIDHTAIVLNDLVDRVTLCEVDRNDADLLRGRETLGHLIYNVNPTGATQLSAVGCHNTDGTGTPHGDTLTGFEAGELDAVPACWEDVSKEGEVGFVLGACGELEAVEVGVGDADVLGLAALVGTLGIIR